MGIYLIGIDEAGYGPRLGPLVITATVFQIPQQRTNLWRALPCHLIPVSDSKVIYNAGRSIKRLETSVLTFASLLFENPGADLSIKQFIDRFTLTPLNSGAEVCWYETLRTLKLPLEADPLSVARYTELLRKECAARSIRLVDIKSEVIEAKRFNLGIGLYQNKAELLFDLTARLLKHLKEKYLPAKEETAGQAGLGRGNQVKIYIGKQGGRTYYQHHLEKIFGTGAVRVLRETSADSSYQINATCQIRFLKDGEDVQFTIALASMFSKYLRELSMKAFNTFWQGYLAGLKPTAGYPQDAPRFIRAITPLCRKLGLALQDFIRLR